MRPLHCSLLLLLKCCFTSTETVGLLGTGAQDVHFDFHTAPELWIPHSWSVPLRPQKPLVYNYEGREPRTSTSTFTQLLSSCTARCKASDYICHIYVCGSPSLHYHRYRWCNYFLSLNPFTAPACKISGLKSAHNYTRLQVVSTFSIVHFDRKPFTCWCEGGKKALMVSSLALLVVVFRVTARQAWQWKG